MLGSEALDVAIGLILVYLLLSLIASAVREGVEGWLKTRSMHLEHGIRALLADPAGNGLAAALYEHPLIRSLYDGGYDAAKIGTKGWMPSRTELPSYIPSSSFALALLDLVARGTDVSDPAAATEQAGTLDLASVRASVARIENPPVQRALLTAIDAAQGSLDQARKNVEAWFDAAMDRVSGGYRRRTQLWLFVIGVAVTVAVNANTLTIIDALYQDESLRQVVVAQAAAVSDAGQAPAAEFEARLAELDALGLPIGWSDGWKGPRGWTGTTFGLACHNLLGWFLTAFAISFGAPFWFDVLNKFMVVRSTVKPHEKSPEESSEDRQLRPTADSASG